MPSRHVVIRAVILSPENTFRTGIPILFTHPLEEGGKEEVVPVTGKVDAIRIARQRISDHGLATADRFESQIAECTGLYFGRESLVLVPALQAYA